MNQTGFGLNADTHAKKSGEFAWLLRHCDNGGTLADTENPARLAGKADHVAGTKAEWRKDFHLEF